MLNFVEKSRELGFTYAWINTCCIDKIGSAQLKEAFNSMYAWYKNSSVCIVYFADVEMHERCDYPLGADIVQSRCFKRGQTLQEPISLKERVFFTRSWKRFSYKLSEITSILEHVLQSGITDELSIAEKTS